MFIRKSGKRQRTERLELPIQERIRMLGEKENYKYLGILKVDTIKQEKAKEKKKGNSTSDEWENFLKTSSAAEITSKE